jgi:hypothetical protein
MLLSSPSIDRPSGPPLQNSKRDSRTAVAPRNSSSYGAAATVTLTPVSRIRVATVPAGEAVGQPSLRIGALLRDLFDAVVHVFLGQILRRRRERNRMPAPRVLSAHVNLYA